MSCRGRGDLVKIGVVVGLKSCMSREWSCTGRERSSSGREEVGYKHDQAIARAWSWILGDRDNGVDLIGSGNQV